MYNDLITPAPLEWNVNNIAVCTAIILVMIINVVALIFTIFWCLRSKDEGGEIDSNGVVINQFVEPNIRMKFKMPKIRGDAIHDSSQDVFELRVPRNGNQFDACREFFIEKTLRF